MLDPRSVALRWLILDALTPGVSAHLGPALSLVEILRVLYDDYLRVFADNPQWPDRDRLVLSKGHGCLALYALLADKGFITKAELRSFGRPGSMLGGHPERGQVPGIEASTGSLGHGLPLGVGMALAARMRRSPRRVVVVTGDGELNEGSVWEAALHAVKHRLDHLTVMVDRNGWQCYGRSDDVVGLDPVVDKFRSFGFATIAVDGHSVPELRETVSGLPLENGRPTAIVCATIKGKGIPTIEESAGHYLASLSGDGLAGLRESLASATRSA